MKSRYHWFFFEVALMLIALPACNLPTEDLILFKPTSTPPLQSPTPVPRETSPTPGSKEPDLTHHPLYWFGPLPPMPTYTGREFIGSEDFMSLFEPDAPWQVVSGKIQVFKLYGEWVNNHPGDAALRQVVADLQRRGLAIAIEVGPLDPTDCGFGIEGFATIDAAVENARAIKSVGGTLDIIALDEPYYYGHFYDGENACHWSAEEIAVEIDEFIQAVRKIFPQVMVGDTEPLAGPAGAQEYNDWLDTFYQVNGYHLAFLHMDIDWSRPQWPAEVSTIQQHGALIGVPIGIIYNGNAFDETDQTFLSASGERVLKLENAAGVQTDHVIFQSWNDKPDYVLPASEPYTYTGFIHRYFTDKANIGYAREGEGANLAIGKPVRVSRYMGALVAALAVDGDYGTLWNAGDGPVQWIEIDLGAEYDLKEIRLFISQFPEGQTTHRILAMGSGTGNTYTVLHTFDGLTIDGEKLVFIPDSPITGIRMVRVETVTSPSWVAWREIEIVSADE
jgi:hypothetical protein